MELILGDVRAYLGHLMDLVPIGPLVLARPPLSAAMAMRGSHHNHFVRGSQLAPMPLVPGLPTGLTRTRLSRLRFLPRWIARRWLRRIPRVATQPRSKIDHLSLEVLD